MSQDRKKKTARLKETPELLAQKKEFRKQLGEEETKRNKEEELKAKSQQEKKELEDLYSKKFTNVNANSDAATKVDYFSKVLQASKVEDARSIRELAIAIGYLYHAKELDSSSAALLTSKKFTDEDFKKIKAAFDLDYLVSFTKKGLEDFKEKIGQGVQEEKKSLTEIEDKETLPIMGTETKSTQPTFQKEESSSTSDKVILQADRMFSATKVEAQSQLQSSPSIKIKSAEENKKELMKKLSKDAQKKQHSMWDKKDSKRNDSPNASPTTKKKGVF